MELRGCCPAAPLKRAAASLDVGQRFPGYRVQRGEAAACLAPLPVRCCSLQNGLRSLVSRCLFLPPPPRRDDLVGVVSETCGCSKGSLFCLFCVGAAFGAGSRRPTKRALRLVALDSSALVGLGLVVLLAADLTAGWDGLLGMLTCFGFIGLSGTNRGSCGGRFGICTVRIEIRAIGVASKFPVMTRQLLDHPGRRRVELLHVGLNLLVRWYAQV